LPRPNGNVTPETSADVERLAINAPVFDRVGLARSLEGVERDAQNFLRQLPGAGIAHRSKRSDRMVSGSGFRMPARGESFIARRPYPMVAFLGGVVADPVALRR
jgi:hypothetical protein